MKVSVRLGSTAALAGVLVLISTAAFALQVRQNASRFDALVIYDETTSLDVATMPLSDLAPADAKRGAWESFRSTFGADWAVHLDRRSGAPMLAQGRGIPWTTAAGSPSIDGYAASLRTFIAANKTLLLADDKELSLNREASTQLTSEVWQIVFDRKVAGIPVLDEQYVFTIGYGNLMSFGASRWSKIEVNPFPELTAAEAEDKVSAYMGLTATDKATFIGKPQLQIAALRAEGKAALSDAVPYAGAVGSGYVSALIWRVVVRVEGQEGTWVAVVDAHTGAVRSFVDDDKYARVKGGVYPIANDQICPEGCEQPGFPMPFATVTIGASTQTSNALGLFDCAPGGSTATTSLSGPFARINDTCGLVAESVSCDADLDLKQSGGVDCAVPAGSGSSGNTHAARTGFYHLNRIAEHARAWLPSRVWLTQQLTNNVNINNTCNAVWSGGTVNFYKSGGGCNNTGEIAGVIQHEWGHGLDQNDGGGFDNPSEAYADITAIMSTHVSCMGRGFRQSGNCSGYGDSCLNCSGIRDLDWDAHASRTPMTPSGFVTTNCPTGSGPCGRETHCEGYVGGQTLWDLAARDLPASGLDVASAWQLTDKLWYKSRNGSGGRAYNCSLPNSDGCSAISWFHKLRVIDDDDGNLANGTPHAAAIYAAFNRHKIACGLATDTSNQNQTSCPAVGVPVLTAVAGSSSVALTWTAAAGATGYRVLRNDASCAAGSSIVATVAGTNYTDSGLANGFAEYYRVQAITSNTACDGNVSNCESATPQPFVGTVKFDAGVYPCSAVIGVSVLDGNVGAVTLQVNIASGSEPAGETITLTETSAGSANYVGSIAITTDPAALDGALSTAHGDAITASYLDGDDGQGGANLPRLTAASADCAAPVITKVEATNVSWNSARITWKTDEPAGSVVRYGTTPPPGGTAGLPAPVFDHETDVSGLVECTTYLFSAGSTDAVGNTATDTASGAYYSFTTGKNSAFDYAALDLPQAIPDQSGVGATSTITVPQSKTVQDVNVTVTVTHPAAGDIVMTLTAPNGTEIPLVIQRGGTGDNFSGTVFDDEATGAIGSGVAPFGSSYRPELPLSVLDGLNSAGAWKLKVEDNAANDVGTFVTWKLTLTTPPAPCGPRAAVQSAAIVTDTCGGGGPGSANGRWDAGEQVQFKTTLLNTGTIKLTNVSATIVPLTPGVSMVDGVATFPAFASGIAVDSQAPHFTALLPTSVSCGSPLSFQITINATEGSWVGTFQQPLGLVLGGTGTPLNEAFATGIPVTWNVVDGGNGGGTASTWTVDDPGLRLFTSPLISPVAIVDSDRAGTGATQDEELLTPQLNLASSPVVTLQFDQYFRWFAGGQDEIADVDVRSSKTNAQWVNVLHQQGSGSGNPDHQTLDISSVAGGGSNVQIRFHNYGGSSEWWWQVDNVRVDTAAYGGCEMPVCGVAQPNVARPVGDGVFGAPMLGSRANASGSSINLTWDVGTCTSADHRVLYGDLNNVALLTPTGSFCDLGSSGAATWTGVPAFSLWFVVVGDNNSTVEGSWGTDGFGGQRGGTAVSGFCGAVTRTNATTCP